MRTLTHLTLICLTLFLSGCGSVQKLVAQPYPVALDLPLDLTESVDYPFPRGQKLRVLDAIVLWDQADTALWQCNAKLAGIREAVQKQQTVVPKLASFLTVAHALGPAITALGVSSVSENAGLYHTASYSQ